MRRLILIVLLLGPLLPAPTAYAAELSVTRPDDPLPDACAPADCSLREALIAAASSAGADTIRLPAGTFTLSLPDDGGAADGPLELASDVTISGAGRDVTIIQPAPAAVAGDVYPVFRIDHPTLIPTVTMRDLSVRGGRNPDHCGGGIAVERGFVLIERSRLADNTAAIGSAICNNHHLSLSESVVENNQAAGGTIANNGSATIVASLITGNRVQVQCGGIWATAGYNGPTTLIVNSTVSGNIAGGRGGGLCSSLGVTEQAARIVVYNSTIVNNRANEDLSTEPGLYGGGVSGLAFYLVNTLLAGNQSRLVTGNGVQLIADDCSLGNAEQATGFMSASNVIVGQHDPASCGIAGTFVVADPLLGPLQNNGGSTLTHLPAAGSPAIDAGDPAGCSDGTNPLTTDQRGVTRPQGTRCDLGAVEVAQANTGPTPVPSPAPPPPPSSNRILLPLAQR